MNIETDLEGYLINRDIWTPEVAAEIAARDGRELTDERMHYINEARRYYEEFGVVPTLRTFIKELGVDKKEIFRVFETGPLKVICKWGGLPKPTGCV
ncbi:MAG: TusE/DsrC/DsvC family sulfur relay protein [Alphaproteobacteria bacterium]|nr:TusE/DsrC/DsvC family sulfur relay protein [Alphaproteobacteria bacterium]MBF0250213.1 TusE/DsrC/DsvC family sulfur relay protein [Alphaproteobacteria bacterium]